MRVVCTVTNDLLQDQRMDRICRSLQAQGYEVTLVGRLKKTSLPLPQRPYKQHRLPVFFQQGKLFYLAYNLRLWWYLRRQAPEIINSVDLDTLLAAYLAKRPSTRWVFDAHEYFSETPEVVNRPLVRTIWKGLAAWLIPKTHLRYTVGQALANIFQQQYGLAFGVVRNLPLSRPATATPERPADPTPKIIYYQGMLNQGRGIETMIEALALLPAHFQLHLVGDGDLLPHLQAKWQECRQRTEQAEVGKGDLPTAQRLFFHGFQPPEQLSSFSEPAWLGINLLDATSPSYYYSLANKCFDYLQLGLPSIQMDFPEYRALQASYDCFVLLSALTPASLAEAVLQLAQNPDRYEQLATNCRRAAHDLHWEKEEKKLLQYWKTLPTKSTKHS